MEIKCARRLESESANGLWGALETTLVLGCGGKTFSDPEQAAARDRTADAASDATLDTSSDAKSDAAICAACIE